MATRRQFLGSSVLGALAAALIPGSTRTASPTAAAIRPAPGAQSDYRRYITMAAAAQATPDFDA